MTEPRTFKVKTSLARQMHEPGGRLVQDAQRMANEALDTHRDDVMTTIAASLEELQRFCAERAGDAGPRVYALASSMIDLAGFFDTGPLYEAAYSLCDVSERMIASGNWRWPHVDVHLQAMKLILADGCRRGRVSDTLLEGLRSVAARTVSA